jgi:hypothetical protein
MFLSGKQKMTLVRKVKLVTYKGSITGPGNSSPEGNYWKLIGSEGSVILDPFKCCKDDRYCDERKLLVVFDISFKFLGLCSYQKNKNSLWISVTDLSEVSY